jgi:hypothetical protein
MQECKEYVEYLNEACFASMNSDELAMRGCILNRICTPDVIGIAGKYFMPELMRCERAEQRMLQSRKVAALAQDD